MSMRKILMLCMVMAMLVPGAGCGPKKPRPNIVLVVMDTVRHDLDTLDPEFLPTLRALAAESTVFDNAWSCAPWTVPSHASMFTGMLASGHHCTHQNPHLDADKSTLAELLTAGGYDTAAFYSNPWLSGRTTDLLRGFVVCKESPVSGGLQGDPGTWRGDQGGRGSVSFFRRWLQQEKGEKPFFAFVNLLEAHLPYDPPLGVRKVLLPKLDPQVQVTGQWGMEYQAGLHAFGDVDWDRLRGLYWGDVATVDHLLSGITASLKEFGLDENTVLIVCSDHGENLGDHELVDHQFSIHETLISVPLLIRAPGYLAVGQRTDPVLLSDLFATIRELAQVKDGDNSRHSHSVLSEPEPMSRPLVAEYAQPQSNLIGSLVQLNPQLDRDHIERSLRTIRVGDLRLTLGSDGEVVLNDMASDPQQKVNIASEHPADVAALRALLEQELAVYRPGASSEIELDEATREQLRSLGYVR